jgi:hypothetical protein
MTDVASAMEGALDREAPVDPRTRRLLEAPVLPLLIRLT